jgi:hypothetical protein
MHANKSIHILELIIYAKDIQIYSGKCFITSVMYKLQLLKITFFLSYFITAPLVFGDGPVGDHVNDLKGHLNEYGGEIEWLTKEIRKIVDRYDNLGLSGVNSDEIIDRWETVKVHSAIESTHVPLYASVWQSLFSIKTGIDQQLPISEVNAALRELEIKLWQSLGAVKLAARYQDEGLLETLQTRSAVTPRAILTEINQQLDRVLAKLAERLPDQALEILQETYAYSFEAVEDEIKEKNPSLARELEVDFKIRLPEIISSDEGSRQAEMLFQTTKSKIDEARRLIKHAGEPQ